MFGGFFSPKPIHKRIALDISKDISKIGGGAVDDLVESIDSNGEIVGEPRLSIPVIALNIVSLFVFYAKNLFFDEFSESELKEFVSIMMYRSLKNIKHKGKLIYNKKLIGLVGDSFDELLLTYSEKYDYDWKVPREQFNLSYDMDRKTVNETIVDFEDNFIIMPYAYEMSDSILEYNLLVIYESISISVTYLKVLDDKLARYGL